jgi:hypothetical protein
MPGVRLTTEQAEAANALLKLVKERLKELSAGDAQLLFSLRRRIFLRLYDERGTPAARKNLKEKKSKEQNGKCAIGGEDLPIFGAELDRLDSVPGYTPENTRLVCHSHHRKQQEKDRFGAKQP